MRWWVTVVLVGCGRIAFDPSGNDGLGDDDAADANAIDARPCTAPVGHDEDADGFDDACDVCPHLADNQSDTDGDQVGDACDPNPTIAQDTIAFFDPMTASRAGWGYSNGGNRVYLGDGVMFPGATSGLYVLMMLPLVQADDYISVGVQVGAAVPTGQRQFGITMLPAAGQAAYYCDLSGDAASTNWGQSYTLDGTNYNLINNAPVQSPIQNVSFRMSVQHISGGLMWQCVTDWPSALPAGYSARPGGINPQTLALAIDGLDVTITYFIHIHSQ